MATMLMVPIHLDALVLSTDQSVVEAVADFSHLPYVNGQRDVNPDVANISEAILSQPFQNQNLHLKAGIHLHWALPDALTKGHHTETGTTFPTVPNRWLVTRSQTGSIAKQWVVESDYLYPAGAGGQVGSVPIPVVVDADQTNQQPFRYLGRKMPLAAWQPHDPTARHLKNLTAIGYGEPTFAAFYPNCHSVFGLHDDDYTAIVPTGLQYDLLGWYSNPGQDYLRRFIRTFKETYQGDQKSIHEALVTALKDESQWTVSLAPGQAFPSQIICYARLTFDQVEGSATNSVMNTPVTVSVGNTGTEALSASLGHTLDSSHKSIIEDQLEALHLTTRLENQQLDIGPKFREARHEKGFTAIAGGSLWTIRPETDPTTAARADESQAQAQMTLPEALAHQLNQLNLKQQAYDRAIQEIESLRRHIFADWYKYMLCAYPPEDAKDDYPNIDEVRYYIEVKDILPLQVKLAATGALALQQDATGKITTAVSPNAAPQSLANQVAQAINGLLLAVAEHNNQDQVKQTNTTYVLKRIPGPRYWQANEPVVLATGQAVKPTPRHGQDGRLRDDGLLECHLLEHGDLPQHIPARLDTIRNKMDEIKAHVAGDHFAFNTWTQPPWHPFLLEWEVEFFPARGQSNLHPARDGYGTDFITANYTLPENQVELVADKDRRAIMKAANVYSGSTILTPHAGVQLKKQLEAYLQRSLPDGFEPQNIDAIVADYEQKHFASSSTQKKQRAALAQKKAQDPIFTALRAYQVLTSLNALAQSLGGFNDALLMHKLTRQLPIADPLAFDDYQPFAEAVRQAVQNSFFMAPQPLNDFNPLRSGALKILRLRLIDTFGQARDLNVNDVITAEPLTLPDNERLIALPPRLVQPARLNFRWLAAAQNEQEMNDHPATNPICGWLLPNNLDNSVMVYDNQGHALGLINQLGQWQDAPGRETPITVHELPNPHLKKVVNYLLERGATFVQHFISALDTALEKIDPENVAQHQGLTLLMGRPIALVRASLRLQLQGLPAIHQGWHAFRQDLKRNTRETDNFTHIQFPIRLGEYGQLNDGLVGYWREEHDGYHNNLFYAPQSNMIQDDQIKTHANDPMTILQTVESPPHILTMLIDPRGVVHATSGILPTKAIRIPPDHYTEALQRINITFLSTPILTRRGQIDLPLPSEPGYHWSWLQKTASGWAEHRSIGQVSLAATLAGQQEILEGWLKLGKEEE